MTICASALLLNHPAAAQTQKPVAYDIAASSLADALTSYGLQSDTLITFPASAVAGKTAPALKGSYEPAKALAILLHGTGLTYRLEENRIIVSPVVKKTSSATDTGSAASSVNNVFAPDEIVVTGTAGSIDKFTAPYAVSTIKEEALLDKAPRSLADMLRNQPGVTVENSGGEGGFENLVIRGLPYIGWRSFDVLEDGIPLYESTWEKYLNIDEIFRVDLMTERAEIVRGGTSSIFSNNASGGALNLITRHGTPAFEGAGQIEGGSSGLFKVAGYESGPITDQLLFAFGGSYRRDDGLRNQGFTGDNGGQVQAGATYLFPDGKGKLFADVKYLNDKSVVYTDIPLTNPLTGASLSGLINPNTGTLTSSSFENTQIRTLNGTPGGAIVPENLSNGIHPEVTTLSLGGDYELGGWQITDRARYTEGTIGFNAVFNAATPTSASSFLGSYLAKAQAAFPGTTALDYSVVGSGTEYNPATTAGLVMANSLYAIQTKIRDVINDVHAAKTFDVTDSIKDDVTVGFYFSSYHFAQQEYLNSILENVEGNPNALDIRALSASGSVLGYVTENGFLSYGGGSLNGSVNGTAYAGYVENALHITPDWQVDAGFRTELRDQSGEQGVLGTQNVDPTGPLAARSVQGVVSYLPHQGDQHGTAYTFGTAYDIFSDLNGFVRYSHAYSFPQMTTIYGGASGLLPNGQPVPVSTVNQAEGGLKFKADTFQAAVTGYYSHFNQLASTAQVAAANGSITNSPIVFNSTTIGVEAEADWRPVSFFDLSGTLTLQNPKIDKVQTLTGLSAQSSVNDTIPRVATYYLSLEPAYIFRLGDWGGRAFADIATIGQRYQDVSNLSILPGYTTLDLGVTVNPTDNFEVRLLVSNVTDSAGLTEGNARGSALGVGTVADSTVGRPIFARQYTASLLYRW